MFFSIFISLSKRFTFIIIEVNPHVEQLYLIPRFYVIISTKNEDDRYEIK